MIYEYSIMAQFIAFLLGFYLQKLFFYIKHNNFLNSLSEETLINIHRDIEKNQRSIDD
jgi:hypothetical protein